jgi:hypothetical protein
MPVTLDVRLDGVEQVVTRIDTLAAAAEDLTAVWPAVGRWYGARARAAFDDGQAKWAPLKSSYLRRKPGGRGIGILSGSLRLHATEDTPDVSEKTYALFGVTRADPTTVLRRAQYLKKGRKSMRSRNIVPALRAGERRTIAQIIGDELTKEA